MKVSQSFHRLHITRNGEHRKVERLGHRAPYWESQNHQQRSPKMLPARHQFAILKQVVELIPRNLVAKLAKEFGVDKQSRSKCRWSHEVSLLFAQLPHTLSLNDIVDTLRNHSGALLTVREAVPPSGPARMGCPTQTERVTQTWLRHYSGRL